jgi:hypothetical protein
MKTNRKSKIFNWGLLFFLTGVIGFLFLIRSANLASIFSDEVAFFAELSLTEDTIGKLDAKTMFDDLVGEKFGIDFDTNISPWIDQDIAIIVSSNKDFILAAKVRNNTKFEKFLDKLKLPSEEFMVDNFNNVVIKTPAFSSQIAIGRFQDWAFFAPSKMALKTILAGEKKLAQSKKFKKCKADMPFRSDAFVFFDTEKLFNILGQNSKFSAQKPLFDLTMKILPAGGISAKFEKTGITFQTKILAEKNVFSKQKILKKPNQTMPELARFVPKNALFFMNGVDLFSKYEHTKKFLEEFDPQFSIIFEGLLQAWSKEVFGEDFNFEQDFLAQMRGQYAIVIDYAESNFPFLNFTLLTGFGNSDVEQNLRNFHDAINFAQSQFSPKIETIKLPDGTKRDELVAAELGEIPIQKIEIDGGAYFTAENFVSNKKFSYGFVENFLVFSTHENALINIFKTFSGEISSFAENEDFRESVLFKFSPSESYGAVNFAKLVSAMPLFKPENDTVPSVFEILKKQIRSIVFARKIFPEAIFATFSVFWR